jgi:(1->4)-alpha-D-glucan 1-alpha-D-glucosylmutase
LRFVERLLTVDRPNPFLDDFLAFQGRIARLGMLNGLSQAVLALTSPGVPDIYQGGDVWDLNMVDPDNRRPVDFQMRRRMLSEVMQTNTDRRRRVSEWLAQWPDGRIKLAVVCALLHCRRRHHDLFARGGYEPIGLEGPLSQHIIGFVRRAGNQICVAVVARMFARLLGDEAEYASAVWGEARLDLRDAPKSLTNVLTGDPVSTNAGLPLGEILADLPAAVLIGQS